MIVDDSHFKSTGFKIEQMRGFYLSEENGRYINVFPIDKTLRYLVPFHEPHEVIAHLRSISEEPGIERKIAVLADDGGEVRPLDRNSRPRIQEPVAAPICDELMKNSDWLTVSTFSKVIDETPPRGIVYLPTASYSEMMEWALPLRAQEQYQDAKGISRGAGVSPMLPGGRKGRLLAQLPRQVRGERTGCTRGCSAREQASRRLRRG